MPLWFSLFTVPIYMAPLVLYPPSIILPIFFQYIVTFEGLFQKKGFRVILRDYTRLSAGIPLMCLLWAIKLHLSSHDSAFLHTPPLTPLPHQTPGFHGLYQHCRCLSKDSGAKILCYPRTFSVRIVFHPRPISFDLKTSLPRGLGEIPYHWVKESYIREEISGYGSFGKPFEIHFCC